MRASLSHLLRASLITPLSSVQQIETKLETPVTRRRSRLLVRNGYAFSLAGSVDGKRLFGMGFDTLIRTRRVVH